MRYGKATSSRALATLAPCVHKALDNVHTTCTFISSFSSKGWLGTHYYVHSASCISALFHRAAAPGP
jgi:hypothetical protein